MRIDQCVLREVRIMVKPVQSGHAPWDREIDQIREVARINRSIPIYGWPLGLDRMALVDSAANCRGLD